MNTTFWDGVLAEEVTWQAVVLISRMGGDYRGIVLVEVVWKAVAIILNRCFNSSITYPDSLYGFRDGYGMGTATLNVKLL